MRSLDARVFDVLNARQRVGNQTPVVYGRGGLSSAEIDAIENALGFATPSDFRFLLQNVRDPGGVLFPWSSFRLEAYRARIDRVLHGVLFDVEENWLWLKRWGSRPDTAPARERLVREDFATWPKLLPISGRRYLPAEPCEAGNPVFSIQQTDIIYYGSDLASYLLNELIARDPEEQQRLLDHPRRIPIWSDFAERTPGFAVDKPQEHYERARRLLEERGRIEPRSWPTLDEE